MMMMMMIHWVSEEIDDADSARCISDSHQLILIFLAQMLPREHAR